MQNFDLQRELAEQNPDKDWRFGAASQPGLVSIPVAERETYLPAGELQFDQYGDFNDCASRSPVNHLEAQFTYFYKKDMRPENKKWLEDKGYVQNGKITFSDRFIAVLSGTTRQGNSLKSPLETIRTKGLIPKALLPKEEWMTWDDYYDRSKITSALERLGQEFLERFTLNYEQVAKDDIPLILPYDMVGVAGYAWARPVDGVYPAQPASMGFNHAFLVYNLPKYQIYDNYYDFTNDGSQVEGDFTKNLDPAYVFFDYGYRVFVSKENTPKHLFLKNLVFGITDPEVAFLQQALVDRGYVIPHAISNFFGAETKDALRKFQSANGIADDGTHCGPLTRLVLNVSPTRGVFPDLVTTIRTFLGV